MIAAQAVTVDLGQLAIAVGVLTGLIGAFIAVSKRRPEIAKVLVEGAQGVVIMQRDLLDGAEKRIDAQEKKIRQLQFQVAALVEGEQARQQELVKEREKVEALTRRVQILEDALRDAEVPIPPEVS